MKRQSGSSSSTGVNDKPEDDPTELESSFELVLSESDVDAGVRKRVQAATAGSRVLSGEDQDAKQILMDALPTIIAQKIRKIVPKDFEISEVQLKLNVSGKLFGTGVSGDVILKLTPAAPRK
ncbi:hypothetical protein [Roseateles toxinivorans]|uniref:Uncharacterized protein n=1 Tax=Roseateles toxinivorans TaxID=270368 RepID=A0A4R6QI94_9BURK|nr:hypothetical protein [Roseateles toxinivorans]TDP62596.1 hypothetical protein DES47_107174 [Roseateles toxinivorans]